MRIIVVNNHTKYLPDLVRFFPDSKVVSRESVAKDPFLLEGYDLVVFSGGSNVPTVLRHPEEYDTEMNFIRKTNSKILGICLGAEIIIEAFGGELQDLGVNHRGIVNVEIVNDAFRSFTGSRNLEVREGHEIGISKIPQDFRVIAKSGHGPEILKHVSKQILAIQFHPEITHNSVLEKWIKDQFSYDLF